MINPVRPEVKAAIEECSRAGIRAVMITGDHKDTAVAIAKELNIIQDASQAITGAELDDIATKSLRKPLRSLAYMPVYNLSISCVSSMPGNAMDVLLL